jgi:hypothetical protein
VQAPSSRISALAVAASAARSQIWLNREGKMSADNLLSESWTDLDSDELRLLLRERFGGGLGQYDGDDEKLYLPLARGESRIVLTFAHNKIAAVEPGEAFDPGEWERVSREIGGDVPVDVENVR